MNKTVFWVMVTGLSVATCTKTTFFSDTTPERTESLAMAPFHRVHVYDDLDVSIFHGDAHHVTITGGERVMQHLLAEVHDGTLTLKWQGGGHPDDVVSIDVGARSIDTVELYGDGSANVRGIEGAVFEASMQGDGELELSGHVDSLKASLYGDGSLDAEDLIAGGVGIELQGDGEGWVFAKNTLRAQVLGDGDIYFSGAPREVRKRVRGAGAILSDHEELEDHDGYDAEADEDDEDESSDEDDDPDSTADCTTDSILL